MTSTDGQWQDPPADVRQRFGSLAPAVTALTAAVAFGAVDQYLPVAIPASASVTANLFATQVSGMSAPWLLLAFLAGAWQGGQRRAALLGLTATWLAVLAYVLMIVSAMEGTHLGPPPPGLHGSWNQLTLHAILMTLASQWRWIAGGLITGPLYGWLGYRWRARRSPAPALLAALPLLGEPALLWLTSGLGSAGIATHVFPWPERAGAIAAEFTELAVGVLLTVAVITATARGRGLRQARRTIPG